MRDLDKYTDEYNIANFEDYQIRYRKRKILEVIEEHAPKRILEIGCGMDPLFNYVEDRKNISAAEDMLMGSLFAGIAFSHARLGDIHAMSHPVSAYFDVPHGIANAILLPAVVEFNMKTDTGKYYEIYKRISLIQTEEDRQELSDELLDRFGEPPLAVQVREQLSVQEQLSVRRPPL